MDDDIAGQFERLGAQDAKIAPAEPDDAFEVMAQNVDAVGTWLAVETQWRAMVGPGRIAWLGLDYAGVDVVLRRSRVADADKVFADLMVMESEALMVFQESR